MIIPALALATLLTYESFLFDIDSLFHHHFEGNATVIPKGPELLKHLQDNKKQVLVVTNDERWPDDISAELKKFGYNIGPDSIISPLVIAADHLKPKYSDPDGITIFHLGNFKTKWWFKKNLGYTVLGCCGEDNPHGLNHDVVLASMNDKTHAVIIGSDNEISVTKLSKAINHLLNEKVDFYVLSNGYTYRGKHGLIYPSGKTTVAALESATQRNATSLGKPGQILVAYLQANKHINLQKTLLIGNNIETDIEFANKNKMDSCFIDSEGARNTMKDAYKAEDNRQSDQVPMYACDYSQLIK